VPWRSDTLLTRFCVHAVLLLAHAVRMAVGGSQTQAYFQNIKLSTTDLSWSYIFTN
jgi:hypothetical protein